MSTLAINDWDEVKEQIPEAASRVNIVLPFCRTLSVLF